MLIELAPLLSAFFMWAAFQPLGWAVLAPVAPTPLLAALRRVETGRGAAAIGFAYGVAFYSLLLFWVKETGYLSVVALVLLLAAYSTVYALLVFRAKRLGSDRLVAHRDRWVGTDRAGAAARSVRRILLGVARLSGR